MCFEPSPRPISSWPERMITNWRRGVPVDETADRVLAERDLRSRQPFGPLRGLREIDRLDVRLPVRARVQAVRFHCSLPLKVKSATPVLLAAGGRVDVLDVRGQPMLGPGAAAISRAEALARAAHAVDLIRIARVERDGHHRALGLDPVVEARPRLAQVLAPVE